MALRSILFLFSLASLKSISAQNLFYNPGFEIINHCTEHHAPCSPSGWFNMQPADIVKVKRANVPSPLLGKNYLIVPVEKLKHETRPYVYTMLTCKLKAGVAYKFNFYLHTANRSFHHLDVLFTAVEPNRTGVNLREAGRIVRIETANIVADVRRGWKAVAVSFIASGDEQFCLFGNLDEEKIPFSETDVMNDADDVFVFIDEIQLVPEDRVMCDDAPKVVELLQQQRSRHTEKVFVLNNILPSEKRDTIILPLVHFEVNKWQPVDDVEMLSENLWQQIFSKSFSRIDIIGHTDNTGSDEYNKNLSQLRANRVRQLILERDPELSGKLFATGMGSTQPVADNSTTEGRMQNRRVELIITRN